MREHTEKSQVYIRLLITPHFLPLLARSPNGLPVRKRLHLESGPRGLDSEREEHLGRPLVWLRPRVMPSVLRAGFCSFYLGDAAAGEHEI